MVNNFQLLVDFGCSYSFLGGKLGDCSMLEVGHFFVVKMSTPSYRKVSFRKKDKHQSDEKWNTIVNMRSPHNRGNRMLLARTQRVVVRTYQTT